MCVIVLVQGDDVFESGAYVSPFEQAASKVEKRMKVRRPAAGGLTNENPLIYVCRYIIYGTITPYLSD